MYVPHRWIALQLVLIDLFRSDYQFTSDQLMSWGWDIKKDSVFSYGILPQTFRLALWHSTTDLQRLYTTRISSIKSVIFIYRIQYIVEFFVCQSLIHNEKEMFCALSKTLCKKKKLTYFARKDLLSCVCPAALSRFSFSSFWM